MCEDKGNGISVCRSLMDEMYIHPIDQQLVVVIRIDFGLFSAPVVPILPELYKLLQSGAFKGLCDQSASLY